MDGRTVGGWPVGGREMSQSATRAGACSVVSTLFDHMDDNPTGSLLPMGILSETFLMCSRIGRRFFTTRATRAAPKSDMCRSLKVRQSLVPGRHEGKFKSHSRCAWRDTHGRGEDRQG